jgi:hypothetical protein
VSIYHIKNFPGASPQTPIQKVREEREGKGKTGEGSKGEGSDGRVREGASPEIKFCDYSIVTTAV